MSLLIASMRTDHKAMPSELTDQERVIMLRLIVIMQRLSLGDFGQVEGFAEHRRLPADASWTLTSVPLVMLSGVGTGNNADLACVFEPTIHL